MERIETDYLVVGAGAVGMAFADVLLAESDADITIVDAHAKPGGHWNDAYPFVTLHQPSAFYGVSSRELGESGFATEGLNAGLAHMATGREVSDYFDAVMRETFLPSGRVRYFPSHEYMGEGRIRSLETGAETLVRARRHVDATWLKATVPSMHQPGFSIARGMRFAPLNALPELDPASDYVVIGGGKTGIDACLWLLENGTVPDAIRWVVPRDAWMIDRENTQPDPSFFDRTIGAQAAQMEALAAADSVEDLFDRLERDGVLLRLDPAVRPRMFHGATISRKELDLLRTLPNVVRMGRVERIERDRIVLERGAIPTGPDVMHVDCSASAIINLAVKPVFEGDTITPQCVRSYQPVFSAAFIAHVEATRNEEREKNELCTVVPLPNHDTDWLRMMVPFMMNQFRWSQDPELRRWLIENRLDGFSATVRGAAKDDEEKQALIGRMRAAAMPAMANLHKLIASLDRKEA